MKSSHNQVGSKQLVIILQNGLSAGVLSEIEFLVSGTNDSFTSAMKCRGSSEGSSRTGVDPVQPCDTWIPQGWRPAFGVQAAQSQH